MEGHGRPRKATATAMEGQGRPSKGRDAWEMRGEWWGDAPPEKGSSMMRTGAEAEVEPAARAARAAATRSSTATETRRRSPPESPRT